MSGHSTWHNIQGRKNAQDAKRGKIFQKISREIYMAAKAGGPDPAMNPALRLVVDKAKAANMPNDNVDRAIKKATTTADEATNVRVAFTRNGGSLGETGSVGYLFDRKGYLAIERAGLTIDEDAMLEKVLEVGGEDLQISPEVFEIYTAPEDFASVRDQLEETFTLAQAELTMIPKTTVVLSEEQRQKLENLIEKLEDDDDVSEVFTSVEDE